MERDASERVSRIVGGCDADNNARIGVALVAGILAHAVCNDAPQFRGCGHHGTAGAHAEALDRAPIRAVVNELVVSSPQPRMSGAFSVAASIDQRLRVLDAQAER
jgi:hypothetical protein